MAIPLCAACRRPIKSAGPLCPPAQLVHPTCGIRRHHTADTVGVGEPDSTEQQADPEPTRRRDTVGHGIDPAAETFLAEICASQTDLARLIGRALRRRASMVVVPAETVTSWTARAPAAWERARQGLVARGLRIVCLPERQEPT